MWGGGDESPWVNLTEAGESHGCFTVDGLEDWVGTGVVNIDWLDFDCI